MGGCIYLLEDSDGKGYIGSTCNLKNRLRQHKENKNKCSSKCLKPDFECTILEEFDNEDDLDYAERFYYDLYKNLYGDKIVNRCRPLQTRKEYNEIHKELYKKYYEEHKAKILEYYEANKDKILENNKSKSLD